MKKLLVVLLIAVVATTCLFAEFDKSNLNINARALGYFAEYGVSYDFGKITAGVEYMTGSPVLIIIGDSPLACIEPFGGLVNVTYQVCTFEHSDLAVGGIVGFSVLEGFNLGPTVEYAYHINENHAVTARVSTLILPFAPIEGLLYFSSVGYRYSF